MAAISFSAGTTIGNITGAESDGVLAGQLTPTNPSKVLLKSTSNAGLAIQKDDTLYTTYTTEFGEATANDVPVLPAVPAVGDAMLYGHATEKFSSVEQNITTQGAGTWTITWKYWNGSAYVALSGVTDGTSGFTAATGWVSTSFTVPTDWEKNTEDGVLAYWVRGEVTAYTAITTQPLIGQGYVVSEDATWTDDTTDFTDAGAGDVDLLPTNPVVGDGLYIGYTEKFCKIKVTTSQARTGTATITLKYWDGAAWTNVPIVDDDTIGWSAAGGTYYIHFSPPANWTANTAANGPDGEVGYFVVMELTALTDVTQQPQATQGWVLPIKTGADGVRASAAAVYKNVDMVAQTKSATNNDSVFLLIDTTKGTYSEFTWTGGDPTDQATISLNVSKNDKLALVQIQEDGTTEFADVSFEVS